MKWILVALLSGFAMQAQAQYVEMRMADRIPLIASATQSCFNQQNGIGRLDIPAAHIDTNVGILNSTPNIVRIKEIELIFTQSAIKQRLSITGEEIQAMGLQTVAPQSRVDSTCSLRAGGLLPEAQELQITIYGTAEEPNGNILAVEISGISQLIP